MLRLKNIKISESIAEADFSPEDSNNWGHLAVDRESGKTVLFEEVPGYGASYKAHAKKKLLEMAKENDSRKECVVMWY